MLCELPFLYCSKTPGVRSDYQVNFPRDAQTIALLLSKSRMKNSTLLLLNYSASLKANGSLVFFVCSLYIHGGRDLKEGPISSMWRVNLSCVHQLAQDPFTNVEWEQVETSGKGPGCISHHKAFPMKKEILFYGGLKGEDSNPEIFIF